MTDVHNNVRSANTSVPPHPAGWGPITTPGAGWPSPAPAPPRSTVSLNGFAIAALCVAVVGLVFSFPLITGSIAVSLGVLGVVFGAIGWARSRRKVARNGWMAVVGLVLGVIVTIAGTYNVAVITQAGASLVGGTTQPAAPAPSVYSPAPVPSYSYPVPYVGPSASPVPAAPTSYTYEVTSNYSARTLSYTESNGDSTIDVEGTELPWRKTVEPEPNGNGQYLSASSESTRGDSWITCTLKDQNGTVIETQTDRGAYASCMLRTWD